MRNIIGLLIDCIAVLILTAAVIIASIYLIEIDGRPLIILIGGVLSITWFFTSHFWRRIND